MRILAIVLIGIMLMTLGCLTQESPDVLACKNSSGAWRNFPDACVDSCRPPGSAQYFCGETITQGCDCGKGKCWNETAGACIPGSN